MTYKTNLINFDLKVKHMFFHYQKLIVNFKTKFLHGKNNFLLQNINNLHVNNGKWIQFSVAECILLGNFTTCKFGKKVSKIAELVSKTHSCAP